MVLASLLGLSACSAVPADSWLISPIEYDNAMDGQATARTDVTYAMHHLSDDTAGGLWTESSGSWLHLDENGDTLSRFNDDLLFTVHGISAVTPTVLAVSRTRRGEIGGADSGLFLFDTGSRSWEKLEVAASSIGDVVVADDGRIVFVEFLEPAAEHRRPSDPSRGYAIRSIDAAGRLATLLAPETVLAASVVEIDVDPNGTVFLSTERETLRVEPDGAVTTLLTYPVQMPVLSVSPAGDVISRRPADAGAAEPVWRTDGGSEEARGIIHARADCAGSTTGELAVTTAGVSTALPFSCGSNGVAWITDASFVLSIGDESGTVLGRITSPSGVVTP